MPSTILAPIKKSRNLRGLIDELEIYWKDEQKRRNEFYNWVTPSIKAEFIEGEIIMHSPFTLKHFMITKRLIPILENYIESNKIGFLGFEKLMCRFTRNDYEPDICFFDQIKSKDFTPDQTLFPIPDFIIEILSISTEYRDRGIKKDDYEAHGVKEYWIVNIDQNIVEQYILKNGEYGTPSLIDAGEIKCQVLEGLIIPLKNIFE